MKTILITLIFSLFSFGLGRIITLNEIESTKEDLEECYITLIETEEYCHVNK